MGDESATHTFDAPISSVWAMFTNPDAHVAKFDGMGHRDIVVLDSKNEDDRFTIKIQRDVDVDLPGFARKVLKPTNTVISTDNWRADGDGYEGDWLLETKGAPVEVKGTTRLTPKGDQTEYTLTFSIKVKVPLIGGKIADWAKGDAKLQVQKEFEAGDTWLADHP